MEHASSPSLIDIRKDQTRADSAWMACERAAEVRSLWLGVSSGFTRRGNGKDSQKSREQRSTKAVVDVELRSASLTKDESFNSMQQT
jgi:hypothetical protein